MPPILPPNFNFPGAQQGIPQGIFQLVQNMAGFGPGGSPGGMNTLSNGLGASISQLMQPFQGINSGATGSGPLPVLPPMPNVPNAPVIAKRGEPTTPVKAPIAPIDFSKLSGTEFRKIQTTGRDSSGKGIDQSKMPAGPTAKQRAEIQQNVRNNPSRR